jgi:hypothetical protein
MCRGELGGQVVPCVVQGKVSISLSRLPPPTLSLSLCLSLSVSLSLSLSLSRARARALSLSLWGGTAVGDTVSMARKTRPCVFEHIFHYVQTKNICTLYTYFAVWRTCFGEGKLSLAEYIAPMMMMVIYSAQPLI